MEIVPVKWTVELEDKLEEILMRNYFDFHTTAKEFSKIVNGDAIISKNADGKQVLY